jgi:translation initiation factor 2 beta subunit (eIF-2beta)/eIF-5
MKSLACIFGRHSWTTHAEHGDEYKVCCRCGEMPKELTVESYAEAQRALARHEHAKDADRS